MLRLPSLRFVALAGVFVALAGWAAKPVARGVSAARDVADLPIPVSGFEAYLVGELHGLQQNEEFQADYLKRLNQESGLRDVAIEEDAVYEDEAQAYVDHRSDLLPAGLCLRAGILSRIRALNAELADDARVRVHLVDIDSPASAIRKHLLAVRDQLQASTVRVPEVGQLREQGVRTIAQLKALSEDVVTDAALRTIQFSMTAWQDGLEADTGAAKGSPYLESREEAVTRNIVDLLRGREVPSLLVLYGADHVSRTARRDGGPQRDRAFKPMALRLEESGVKAFSVVTFPLEGRSYWRGSGSDLPWTAQDGHLETGEVLGGVLAGEPDASFLYIDTKQHRVRLPSQDISRMAVDAFLLFRVGSPMAEGCGK
jgi:hypothetical protein